MKRHTARRTGKAAPTIFGTGLIALDVVVNETRRDTPRLWAGGTCGNVLTILSYLGWQSFPIARLAGDNASKYIAADLARWNVNHDFISLAPQARAPIIVQHLTHTASGLP